MLTIQEIRQLPDKDLQEELQRASREYLKIRMDVESGFAKESHKAKALKKQIARIRTIQKEIK
ncbi:50S ribosomal protein L29 [Patescibacteria group bacterium]|nr:50S ribosomal protein L29 [Patescibacteria group bacterium]MBU1703513.1 50S ribosomal protein L29 [Patescibacteria group bacterium]MBU1953420.1 50S ribosomal protein L29 [Patescibacteria group bacterium]